MKKRSICLILAGIMAFSALTGCGAKSESGKSETGKSESESQETKKSETLAETEHESKKLVVWGGLPEESGPADVITLWNEQHPEVQAEYVRFVNDDTGNTKLDTALQSGEQIDVFFTYSNELLAQRASNGMLEDLESFDAAAYVEENIIGGVESFTRVDDKIYAIPTVSEPNAILINKDMLDEKGITIPDNWTVSEFEEVARRLTGEADGKTVYGAYVYDMMFATSVLGGDKYYKSETESNFDHDVYKVNTQLKAMMDEGIAMPYDEIFSRSLEGSYYSAFLSGEIAMMPAAEWMLRYVNDEEEYPHDFVTTFASFPSMDDGTPNPYVSYNGNMICMNSRSENKEEAWEFMKFWITEGCDYVTKKPAYVNADQDAIIANILGENPEERYDVEAYKEVFLRDDFECIVQNITTASNELSQMYKEETQNYYLDVTTEDEYYTNMKERGDQILQSAQ